MKYILNALFRGTVFMAPKCAVIIILFGAAAAYGEHFGLTKPVYTSIAVVGIILGIVSVLYEAREERKEAEARNQK